MLEYRLLAAPVLLAAQGLLVHWSAGREILPAPPDFTGFPTVAGWARFREDPILPEIASQLGADRMLSCSYRRGAAGPPVGLFVAWFQSQRAGASQPHSPKVCLPASGWTPQSMGVIALDTAAGPIRVNRYIVDKGPDRAVVLYWYQTGRRVMASELDSKLEVVFSALRDRRTDLALVRIVTWERPGRDGEATAEANAFARELYPILRDRLPR